MSTTEIISNECYTREQLAVHFGVSVNSITDAAKQGLLPVMMFGAKYIFPRRAVEAYEAELGRVCGEAMAKKLMKEGEIV